MKRRKIEKASDSDVEPLTFLHLGECLTLFFKIKIDNNFDNKFYKNRAEQYRIILFEKLFTVSQAPGNPHRKYLQ